MYILTKHNEHTYVQWLSEAECAHPQSDFLKPRTWKLVTALTRNLIAQSERNAMVFLILLALMAGLGFFHHFSLGGLMRILPAWVYEHRIKPLAIFAGMAVVHFLEIAILSLVIAGLSQTLWPDSFSPGFGGSMMDFLFLTASMFTTLGYADFSLEGPMRMIAAEITREKIYLQLHQELPYASAVETEAWTERDDGSVRIEQVIYVERPNQKGIVLGKGGSRIKAIGAATRAELESLLERRVHLFLYVKVRENWPEDPERYLPWGLDYHA